jgi:MOSC domain-containing protein YiiM
MELLTRTVIAPGTGLEGDSRGRMAGRNVSILSEGAWIAACRDLSTDVPWTYRRANLLIRGLDLEETAGRRLRVGPVVLEVTRECDPCNRMEEQKAGLRAALTPDWRGGIVCSVIVGGEVVLGDDAAFVEAE